MLAYTEEYISDLTEIRKVIPNLEKVRGKRILVTGAGGLIGSAIVDFFLQLNRDADWQTAVYAAGRSRERMSARFQDRAMDEAFHFFPYDAMQEIDSGLCFDYALHAAGISNTSSYAEEPVEVMLTILTGTKHMLEYARRGNVGRLVCISSSEVYGKKDGREPYGEDDYGYIDLLNPRACYPVSKRAAETLCASYDKEYGIAYVTARPGHVYGPTAAATDRRAVSQFAWDVHNGKDIVMKSAGVQLRSYCYVLDCVSALVTIMINGERGTAYNVSNPHAIVSIRGMAECFARAAGRRIVFAEASERERAGYNMMDNSALVSDRLEALGWRGLFDMETGAARTLHSLVD